MRQAFSNISTRTQVSSVFSNLSVWFAGIAVMFLGSYLILHQQYRLFIAVFLLCSLLMVWRMNRTAALCFMLAFLMLIGDVRRIMNLYFGAGTLDPLLVISSIFCLYLAIPILIRLRFGDTLSKLVVALMAVMLLEVFNPRQGSLLIGFSGALFFMIPLFWYWVGRRYATDQMIEALLFKVFVPLSLLDAFFGFYQTVVGPFPWQMEWLRQFKSGYMYSPGHYRTFGFSTSVPEFAATMLIGTTLVVAAIVARRRLYWFLLPIAASALVLSSARGYIVKVLFSGAIIWAVMGRSSKAWIPRFVFALALGIGLTVYTASHTTVSQEKGSFQEATAHTVEGLANPTHSTAIDHKNMALGAIAIGFKNPIGYGLGYTTLANNKFGGSGYSSETDISDLFMATGFPGGLLYVAIILVTIKRLLDYCKKKRGRLALGLIGVLAAMLGGWFGEGQYSMGFLLYFCVGFVSREAQPGIEKSRQQVPARQMNILNAVT